MNNMNPAETLRVGVLPLARPTFDVPYAEQMCENAWKVMEQIPVEWVGSSKLLFDAKSVESQLLKFETWKRWIFFSKIHSYFISFMCVFHIP